MKSKSPCANQSTKLACQSCGGIFDTCRRYKSPKRLSKSDAELQIKVGVPIKLILAQMPRHNKRNCLVLSGIQK